jgi:hypothetical protein
MYKRLKDRRLFLRGTSLLATAAVGISITLLMAPAASATSTGSTHGASSGSPVMSYGNVGVGFTTLIDPATHTMKILTSQGTVEAEANGKTISKRSFQPSESSPSAVVAKPHAIGSYQCIVDTQDNSNFKGYTPEVWTGNGNDYQFRFQFNGYSVDDARFISGYWTFQTEQCFTGGGTAFNYWHQWYIGASTTEDHDNLIGDVWGTAVINNTVSTTLNFNVSVGPVSIGGSTTVNGGDQHTGSLGHDPYTYGYPYSASLDGNRVNAFYLAPNDSPTDGTALFEGNNGQALWEQPENGSETVTYNYDSGSYLCSLPDNACGNFS